MIHPNPRYYKYLWWIYTEDSLWEDQAFFDHSPKLCTHDAMVWIETLKMAGQTFIVYNESLPRRGAGVPLDFNSARCVSGGIDPDMVGVVSWRRNLASVSV